MGTSRPLSSRAGCARASSRFPARRSMHRGPWVGVVFFFPLLFNPFGGVPVSRFLQCGLGFLLALCVAVAGCDTASSPPPPPETLTEAWQADVDALVQRLEDEHPAPFQTTSRRAFVRSLNAVVADVETSRSLETTMALMQAVATLGDSHTAVNPWATRSPERLPFQLYDFGGDLYVTHARGDHADLLGSRLVQIGAHRIDTSYAAVKSTIGHENDWLLRELAARRVSWGDVLHGLGLLPQSQSGAFVFDQGGARTERTLSSDAPGAWQHATESATLEPSDSYYAFAHQDATKTLYIQYNRCAEAPGRPFRGFVDDAMSAYATHRIDRVVLDLRHNSGGNSRVVRPLLDAFDARDVGTNVPLAVLIGRQTASSAVLNALEIDARYPASRFFGEPTGGKPNHFGEVRSFRLPHSNLTVHHSTKYFEIVPGNAASLFPDHTVRTTADDYFAGHDPVLEAAVQWE